MNDSLYLILGMIFLGLTVGTWLLTVFVMRSWINYRENFTQSVQDNLHTMFLFVDARKVFLYNVLAIVVVPVAVWAITQKIFFAVLSGATLFMMPKLIYRWLHRRRLLQFDQALPDALSMIAGSMRAGASLPTAIEGMVRETEGPVSQEFSLLMREQRMGKSLDEAFENLGQRVTTNDLALAVAAARIARDVGGSLAEIFERLADVLRQKAVMEGKIRSLTSQGKMQGWVVGLLPIAIIAVLFQMEPEAMAPLFTSLMGWCVLAVIILLELMGAVLIKKIVSIDV